MDSKQSPPQPEPLNHSLTRATLYKVVALGNFFFALKKLCVKNSMVEKIRKFGNPVLRHVLLLLLFLFLIDCFPCCLDASKNGGNFSQHRSILFSYNPLGRKRLVAESCANGVKTAGSPRSYRICDRSASRFRLLITNNAQDVKKKKSLK